MAHPECKTEIMNMVDVIGSTERMVTYCMASPAEEFIVLTKIGMRHRLGASAPAKGSAS